MSRPLSVEEEPPSNRGVVKQSRLKDLRAKHYQGGEEEWELIVASRLLQRPLEDVEHSPSLAGLEVVATVKEEEDITLIIRKSIGGITVSGLCGYPYDRHI